MAGFSLFGKVKFDASAFYKGLTGMKAAAAPAGAQIGKQLGNKLAQAIGVGGAFAAVKKSLQDAFNIRRDAGKLGIDTETFQTLQTLSEQTGTSIDDLVKKMTDGSEEGMAFADAIKATNAELLEQGRIVDAGTTEKLANAFQRISELTGKIAPGIAAIADGLMWIYDKVDAGVNAAVAGATHLAGVITGDSSLKEAGSQLATDAFNGTSGGDSVTAEGTAREMAKEIGKAVREENTKDKTPKASSERLNSSFSSDTAGRIFGSGGPVKSPVETQLALLNRSVADIKSAIGTFK